MKNRNALKFLSIAAAAYALAWLAVETVIIPGFVIPGVREYIAANFSGEVKLAIKDISFHPFRGFLLRDVKISGPLPSKDNYILRAKLVDINLALPPLLWKRIKITEFALFGADLNIERSASGAWNFQPLLELAHSGQEGGAGESGRGFSFEVEKFTIKSGWIDYADYYKEGNTLERRFSDVNLELRVTGGHVFRLVLSGGSQKKAEESIELDLDYDKSRGYAAGRIKLNTQHLGQYWDYYLDDWLRPWRLEARNINAELGFEYSGGALALDGQYGIDGGTLRYGDLSIKGNAQLRHKQVYAKSGPSRDIAEIQASLQDVSSLSGEYVFLEKGNCSVVITKEKITIGQFSGTIRGQPFNLSGKFTPLLPDNLQRKGVTAFTFQEPGELSFKGAIANLDTDFALKLLPDNQGALDWRGSVKDSYIRLHADIKDLKSHLFNLRLDCNMRLEDLSGADKIKVKGLLNIAGDIQGELDKALSLQGGLAVNIDKLSAFDTEPVSFASEVAVKDGLFRLRIPEVNFYKGILSGALQWDLGRWGFQLHIDGVDIETFAKQCPFFEGVKGVLGGNIACVSKWLDLKTISGGGYFKLINCDIRKAPLFAVTEKGIASIIENFIMPEIFKKVEGNFEIKNEAVVIKNAYCASVALSLGVEGKCGFCGESDFTVGVNILKGSVLKTARQVIFPITIGFDALVNAIKVNISGRWPDMKSKASVEPMGWLNDLFGLLSQVSPERYTLEKLWR